MQFLFEVKQKRSDLIVLVGFQRSDHMVLVGFQACSSTTDSFLSIEVNTIDIPLLADFSLLSLFIAANE
jgi:hypothetical protein